MLKALEIQISLTEPDCNGIELSNWYDETTPVDDMEISLGSADPDKQELLTFTGKTNEDVVVLQFCLGVVIKATIDSSTVEHAETDYLTVADGELVLTSPDPDTFSTTKLN